MVYANGLALIALKSKAMDYIGHLSTIMLVGILLLVPSMILSAFHVNTWYIPVISVVCSSLYMLYLHIHRMRFLQISQGWTLLWFMLIQYGAMFWSYSFHTRI